MRDELSSLIENEVFELCELPLGAAVLTGKWNLNIKRGTQGQIERFKARYVVRGSEIHGLDFHETWTPVGHYTTPRCLLVICACENLRRCILTNSLHSRIASCMILCMLLNLVSWMTTVGESGI